MAITNNVGCPVADCPVDLNYNCLFLPIRLKFWNLTCSVQVQLRSVVLLHLMVTMLDARVLASQISTETKARPHGELKYNLSLQLISSVL